MSPKINIRKRDRKYGWLSIDFQEDDDIGAVVVIPSYGPTHHALMDCWCEPKDCGGVIVHNEVH